MGTRAQTMYRTPADDVLDYAMTLGLLTTFAITIGLIMAGAPALLTIIGMGVLGTIWTFTITPHLVAYWLDIPVDTLLDVKQSNGYTYVDEHHS